MSLSKPQKRVVKITELHVDQDVNIRLKENYDLPSMKMGIVDAGRILKPIIAELVDGRLLVLSGNRRTLAGQELFADGSIAADLKDALSKVDVLVYSNLTEKERLQLILDHGQEKAICRTETILAVWRLAGQLFSEIEIVRQMFHALARYTRNEQKLKTLPPENEPRAREKALGKWFHGTVGNFMLAAMSMGQFVRDQLILTTKAEDGLLGKDEKITMKVSRDRIRALSEARELDKSKDGHGWNPDEGGVNFNAKIQQFRDEDSGAVTVEKVSKPTSKQMLTMADTFRSTIARTLCKRSAGEAITEDLNALDSEVIRFQDVTKAILAGLDNVPTGQVKVELHTLLGLIAVGKPDQVAEFFTANFPAAKS
jgi:hypothetical protein